MQYEKMLYKNNVPKERVKRITDELKRYKEQTIDGHIIHYLNGFIAAGILETPEDHITQNANTIWIYGLGSNIDDSEIEVTQDCCLTEDEAEGLCRALKIALSKHKKYYKKVKAKDIKYKNVPRDRI